MMKTLVGAVFVLFFAQARATEIPQSDISFDDLRAEIVNVTGMEPRRNFGDTEFEADYQLHSKGFFASRVGDAQSFFKGVFFPLEDDNLDEATKTITISGNEDGTHRIWGMAYIKFECSVIEYQTQGVSRGQYSYSVALLKGANGSVFLMANPDNVRWEEDVNQDVKLSWDRGRKTLVVNSADQGGNYQREELVINLNSTLDCLIRKLPFGRSNTSDQYLDVAFFNRGQDRF
jgi:hypothetical protein